MRSVVRTRQERRRLSIEMMWSMAESGFAGHGLILDLSEGGARLQLKRNLPIAVGSPISVSSAHLNVTMPMARVRWVRQTAGVTVCGIAFDTASPHWSAWVEANRQALRSEAEVKRSAA